jgi:hypothetical protein
VPKRCKHKHTELRMLPWAENSGTVCGPRYMHELDALDVRNGIAWVCWHAEFCVKCGDIVQLAVRPSRCPDREK